jgi:hypothetical protein
MYDIAHSYFYPKWVFKSGSIHTVGLIIQKKNFNFIVNKNGWQPISGLLL